MTNHCFNDIRGATFEDAGMRIMEARAARALAA